MNTIEYAQKYIKNTGIPKQICVKYDMKAGLLSELLKMDGAQATVLAFQYGRAKGYRAAQFNNMQIMRKEMDKNEY